MDKICVNGDCENELPEGVTQQFVDDVIDQEAYENFLNLAKDLKLSPEQTKGIWFWVLKGASSFVAQCAEGVDKYCSEVEGQLRSSYGDTYETKKQNAVRLVKQLGGEEFVDFLRSSGVGSRKEMISFLIKLSDMLDEDKGLVGEKSAVFSSSDAIKDEIARLMAYPAYMQGQHPEHDGVVQKVYGLRKRLLNEEK